MSSYDLVCPQNLELPADVKTRLDSFMDACAEFGAVEATVGFDIEDGRPQLKGRGEIELIRCEEGPVHTRKLDTNGIPLSKAPISCGNLRSTFAELLQSIPRKSLGRLKQSRAARLTCTVVPAAREVVVRLNSRRKHPWSDFRVVASIETLLSRGKRFSEMESLDHYYNSARRSVDNLAELKIGCLAVYGAGMHSTFTESVRTIAESSEGIADALNSGTETANSPWIKKPTELLDDIAFIASSLALSLDNPDCSSNDLWMKDYANGSNILLDLRNGLCFFEGTSCYDDHPPPRDLPIGIFAANTSTEQDFYTAREFNEAFPAVVPTDEETPGLNSPS